MGINSFISYDHFNKVPADLWPWPDFSPREMSCRGSRSIHVSVTFMNKIQSLRAVMGIPITVSSGYRSPEHNAKVSGTGLNGPHTTGRAVDFAITGPDAFRILELAMNAGHMFTGVGVKQKGPWSGRFLHLDDLPNGDHPRPRIWSY